MRGEDIQQELQVIDGRWQVIFHQGVSCEAFPTQPMRVAYRSMGCLLARAVLQNVRWLLTSRPTA
jgi:hypothetical protein